MLEGKASWVRAGLCLSMQEPLHPCQVHPVEPTPREILWLWKERGSPEWKESPPAYGRMDPPWIQQQHSQQAHRHCILHCWTSKDLEPKLSQEKGNAINYCVSIQHYTLSFNVLQIKGEVLYSIDVLCQGKWGLGPPYMKKKKKKVVF